VEGEERRPEIVHFPLYATLVSADTWEVLLRRPLGQIGVLLGACAAIPVVVLLTVGDVMVMPPLWVHFYGVGVSAIVATLAAVVLTTVGAHEQDSRTVIVGGGFALMAALLAVHGLVTPGVIVGNNGLIALTGAATLPVGGVVLALAALPPFTGERAIPRVLAVEGVVGAAIVVVSVLGAAIPSLVPTMPSPKSPAAIALFAIGLAVYGALAVRAMHTFLLTQRFADLAVVVGIVLLATALYSALFLSFMQLGWWLGHVFELTGIVVVGSSLVWDLRRGRRSRTLVGDLSAAELVASEEAFFGARVRALMVRLHEKDTSTEAHTRRVASLAVAIGEQLGLSPAKLRSLAIGGLLHDIGKLSIPNAILQKPSALDDGEYETIKLHPERGKELLLELGGFDESVTRLVLDHHERLDGTGYPRGVTAASLDIATRILAVCDVYDALVSDRVYRAAWSRNDALDLLRRESGTAFDERCVDALETVVSERPRAVAHAELAARFA
jgi:HD-GYP domain-containing protein (c-di-GMP phosphodiesterase class II)